MPATSRLLIVLCLTVSTTPSALAASFADRFRDFIVGSEAQASSRAPALDTSARGCLQCHDGLRAAHIAVRTSGSALQIRGSQTLNHPVGMVYERSVMKDPQGYKSRAALHPNVRLVEGQVSCVSCHQTRGEVSANTHPEPRLEFAANTCTATKELTVGHRDRELCMACHNK